MSTVINNSNSRIQNKSSSSITNTVRNKGNSIISFPSNFVMLDIETTGLNPKYDEIIEVAIIRVRNNEVSDEFQSLIKPTIEIDERITNITNITNDMLSSAPTFKEICSSIFDFIGNDIVIGHNINFDINFLYDNLFCTEHKEFKNDFVDTLRIARKLLPNLSHHRLSDLSEYYNISYEGAHRALTDCYITLKCFNCLHKAVIEECSTEEQFIKKFDGIMRYNFADVKEIKTNNTFFDEDNPFFGKNCVFTGQLSISRTDAAKLVVDVGGHCQNYVTKTTDYLILGSYDYYYSIKGDKSTKHMRAEELNLKGCDIKIITEDTFFDMLSDY